MDSVEVSLITCGPGDEVYSLYGHTALRYRDSRSTDVVVNYGLFSFEQDWFILRFLFGITDYRMGIIPFQPFLEAYQEEGRWVKEQTLNLTAAEKYAIGKAIFTMPESERVYRYNYFYNNCTTKARDLVASHLQGTLVYQPCRDKHATFRSMTHQWNAGFPWSRLGNDLLLGIQADRPTSKTEQQFLPDSLSRDFATAIIVDTNGSKRQLVSKTTMLYGADTPTAQTSSHPFTPTLCAWLLFFATLAVARGEHNTHKLLWGYDALLWVAQGLAGLILLAMLFSQHPTVRINFQILIFCPLSLVFAWPVILRLRQHRLHPYLYAYTLLLLVGIIMGGWQRYDTFVYIVSLSLLTRIITLHYRYRTKR